MQLFPMHDRRKNSIDTVSTTTQAKGERSTQLKQLFSVHAQFVIHFFQFKRKGD